MASFCIKDDDSARYKIVRSFFNTEKRITIKTNLTLAQAQAHCKDPETSSSTCKKPVNVRRTERYGKWFDGYDKCTRR